MLSKDVACDLYGPCVITQEGDCVICRIKDKSGDVVLTRYEVYPGIALVYNDVHTPHISVDKVPEYHNIIEINHCREGRIEFESIEGEYLYIKKGDMAVNNKSGVKDYSNFPQSHYHGVTIELDLDYLQDHRLEQLEQLELNPMEFKERFCRKNRCFILHEKEEFEHLFGELYRVPEKIRKRYDQLKVLEILLFLSAVDEKAEHIENRYFNKNQVARTKEAHAYMTRHPEEKITIGFLAQKYKISQTNLKKCFKEIYGNSIYAYLKEYRIHEAAKLLKETDMEIGKIAGMAGYDNASKFAQSFKSVMGINPREYRKNV